jgi:hypothetical protein
MNNEQSILLTIRHQMSTLGYSEDEINLQDESISHFTKLLVNSINLERKRKTQLSAPNSEKYKYFMHINNPDFNRSWAHDALMSCFDSDWGVAVTTRDIDTCIAIVREVTEFCKTHRVPSSVVDFYKNTPALLAADNWKDLRYNGIVDAYCDEDKSEYVDGVTGED